MKNKKSIFLLALLLCFSLAACQTEASSETSEAASSAQVAVSEPAESTATSEDASAAEDTESAADDALVDSMRSDFIDFADNVLAYHEEYYAYAEENIQNLQQDDVLEILSEKSVTAWKMTSPIKTGSYVLSDDTWVDMTDAELAYILEPLTEIRTKIKELLLENGIESTSTGEEIASLL